MSILFKKNDFRTDYKKRPFDGYKAAVEKLDEETKRKLDKQRQTGMILVVAFVFLLVVILAVTGIGIDKNRSGSGNVFADKETVLIECFGDSITEGFTILTENGAGHAGISDITYPEALSARLPVLLQEDDHTYKCKDIQVKNYGMSGSVLKKESASRLSGSADIVLILYTANNFQYNEEYEGTLEQNISTVLGQGSRVFLLNYPTLPDSVYEINHQQANNYIANTAKAMDIPLIDVCGYFAQMPLETQTQLFSPDGVHLTEDGYQTMGDYIAEEIHQYYYQMY